MMLGPPEPTALRQWLPILKALQHYVKFATGDRETDEHNTFSREIGICILFIYLFPSEISKGLFSVLCLRRQKFREEQSATCWQKKHLLWPGFGHPLEHVCWGGGQFTCFCSKSSCSKPLLDYRDCTQRDVNRVFFAVSAPWRAAGCHITSTKTSSALSTGAPHQWWVGNAYIYCTNSLFCGALSVCKSSLSFSFCKAVDQEKIGNLL